MRARLLRKAGVACEVDPADLDEAALKASLGKASAETVAEALARAKAEAVSARYAGALVIGADQVLECGGTLFDKPADREAALGQLMALSGRTHRLVSATAVVRDGKLLWAHVEDARLTMWAFDETFARAYLRRAGRDVLGSVGAYRVEGLGIQLFENIEGDYFCILGLSLLPLLRFLRRQGALAG